MLIIVSNPVTATRQTLADIFGVLSGRKDECTVKPGPDTSAALEGFLNLLSDRVKGKFIRRTARRKQVSKRKELLRSANA